MTKMKGISKNKIIPIVGSFMLIVSMGCNKDVLEVDNPNALTEDTFWQTERDFNAGLNTVYAAQQFTAISGGGVIFENLMGDEAGTEDFYRQIEFATLNFGDASEQVVNKWNELYVGIFRANQVIDQVIENPDVFESPQEAALVEAQARCLRAFYYFLVAHTYGGAVIKITVPQSVEDQSVPFSSIAEVTEQVLIPDLTFAKNNLPPEWSQDELGRVTRGTATALLGKAYLFTEQWALAAAEFREVIDSGVYSLVANPLDNFSHLTEYNPESILETAFSLDFNPGSGGDIIDGNPFSGETGSEATNYARSVGQLQFGGFNVLLPSYNMHEMYVRDEIDPNNPVNGDNSQSLRMGVSIVPMNGDGLFYNLPIGERPGWVFGQSTYTKKYANWYHADNEDTFNRSEINFRHIRLADVYLMYAEAILEASGDVATAIEFIDRVRTRAGVITLQQYINDTGGFPPFHISEEVNGPQANVPPTVENIRTHIRRVERPLELGFEGHRWKDLVRWGIVREVLDQNLADEQWRFDNIVALNVEVNADAGTDGNGVAPLFIREKIRPDYGRASANYTPELHDYFPIPVVELQTNEELGN